MKGSWIGSKGRNSGDSFSPLAGVIQHEPHFKYSFRDLNARMTPLKRILSTWKRSAKLRKRPITLPTTPFNHREDES